MKRIDNKKYYVQFFYFKKRIQSYIKRSKTILIRLVDLKRITEKNPSRTIGYVKKARKVIQLKWGKKQEEKGGGLI